MARKLATFRSRCCAGCCQTGHSSQGSRAALPRAPRTHPAQPCRLLPSSRTSWPLPDPPLIPPACSPLSKQHNFQIQSFSLQFPLDKASAPTAPPAILTGFSRSTKTSAASAKPPPPPPHLPPLPFFWQLVGISPDCPLSLPHISHLSACLPVLSSFPTFCLALLVATAWFPSPWIQ